MEEGFFFYETLQRGNIGDIKRTQSEVTAPSFLLCTSGLFDAIFHLLFLEELASRRTPPLTVIWMCHHYPCALWWRSEEMNWPSTLCPALHAGSPPRQPAWWTCAATRWMSKTAPWRSKAVSTVVPDNQLSRPHGDVELNRSHVHMQHWNPVSRTSLRVSPVAVAR